MKPVSKTDRLLSINVQAHLTGVRAMGIKTAVNAKGDRCMTKAGYSRHSMMSTRRYGSQ